MADLADMAQAEQERLNARSAERLTRDHAPKALEFCAECGEPIPEARRLAVPGCRLCIDCQTERECG